MQIETYCNYRGKRKVDVEPGQTVTYECLCGSQVSVELMENGNIKVNDDNTKSKALDIHGTFVFKHDAKEFVKNEFHKWPA